MDNSINQCSHQLGNHVITIIFPTEIFPNFPLYRHTAQSSSDRQVNHNSHLSQSLYASCTREYATDATTRHLGLGPIVNPQEFPQNRLSYGSRLSAIILRQVRDRSRGLQYQTSLKSTLNTCCMSPRLVVLLFGTISMGIE